MNSKVIVVGWLYFLLVNLFRFVKQQSLLSWVVFLRCYWKN